MTETVATGVVMRIGTYDTANYPNRTQREVHPARRDESITYTVKTDGQLYGTSHVGEAWEHYRYTFVYRFLGRVIQIGWACGTLYGDPKPLDGLRSAFWDADAYASADSASDFADSYGYEDPGTAEKIFNACERMNARLDRFFGSNTEREIWATILEENNE